MCLFWTFLNDMVWFPVFEIIFFGTFLYALLIPPRGGIQIIRGESSWLKLITTWSILSVILSGIVSSCYFLDGIKTFFVILNLAMLIYLVFFNAWFRNKIIGYWSWLEKRPEK